MPAYKINVEKEAYFFVVESRFIELDTSTGLDEQSIFLLY